MLLRVDDNVAQQICAKRNMLNKLRQDVDKQKLLHVTPCTEFSYLISHENSPNVHIRYASVSFSH